MSEKPASPDRSLKRGKLRIGNDWNAITIIAIESVSPYCLVLCAKEDSIAFTSIDKPENSPPCRVIERFPREQFEA